MAPRLRIGELARRAGISVEAIRYYEKQGLLAAPPRLASGYRSYPAATIRRLRFVRRAQGLGFTLGEVAELLALRVGRSGRCHQVQKTAELRLHDVEVKIARLTAIRAALAELIEACSTRTTTEECPLLAALAREDEGGNLATEN
jgi:Hg(II)-responsive transcriptional regulator